MTQMPYYYSWAEKTMPKKCTIVRVVTEGISEEMF